MRCSDVVSTGNRQRLHRHRRGLQLFVALLCLTSVVTNAAEYYGKYLGPLKSYHHGLGGDVYAVDARTLHIRNFVYDGEGPAAYFYGSNGKQPGINGYRIRDEKASTSPLKRYRNEHLTITLPEGLTLHDIKWFYVWCEDFSVNFGDIKIPYNLDYPKPQKIDSLSGIHGVSSENIVVVDAQTLLIPGFSYDGEAPDAKFWVGAGDKPTPQGVRVADENGKEVPLRRYNRKTIVLTLPGDLTIFDIGHFGIWCEAFTVDFGHVSVPSILSVPPSLKMLGVLPQKPTATGPTAAAVTGLQHYQQQHQQQQQTTTRKSAETAKVHQPPATTYRPIAKLPARLPQKIQTPTGHSPFNI